MASTVSHHTGTRITDAASTERIAADIEHRLRAADRLVMPLEDTLELLDQLQQFELGRFLLHNRGLNGYWTSYIFRNRPEGPVTPLEHWLLNNSLLCQARERYHRFRKLIAEHITDGATLASVPCGVMDDLLEQDYRKVTGIRLVGVDLDTESLRHAEENARRHGLAEHATFRHEDAWNLTAEAEFDLVVSNGLNMYESDPARLTDLYRAFHKALRPGGRLLISFLTPPPPPPWEAPSTPPPGPNTASARTICAASCPSWATSSRRPTSTSPARATPAPSWKRPVSPSRRSATTPPAYCPSPSRSSSPPPGGEPGFRGRPGPGLPPGRRTPSPNHSLEPCFP
ncbi:MULTISPECIES: SAM-dependent methyltransferase [Actinomycetes]|uniref:SAM-dependent methyltransferase n=1 Tax=Actinomycetes TaxID=1760 RepID=UPI00193F39DF|nr:class I SAM-dependent methyltransferase [Actinospica acidiphila]MBM4827832.1 class I SAM-dependent methyltransferase [Actinospica acidiphila]MCC9688984.1 class I SAM-dependent methyltransferase [Streptomyces sp. MNU103]